MVGSGVYYALSLDGLVAVGEGLDAPHESILIDRIAGRTALLALLVQTLSAYSAS